MIKERILGRKYYVKTEGTNRNNVRVIEQTINGREYCGGDEFFDEMIERTLEETQSQALRAGGDLVTYVNKATSGGILLRMKNCFGGAN